MQKSSQKSGKVVTIFLIVIAILLVSMTAISLFFLQKETEKRKSVESDLNKAQTNVTRLDTDLKDAKKQIYLLEEKNKEADQKINNLMDELELEKALKEESKKEKIILKEQIEKQSKDLDEIRQKLADDATVYKTQIDELQVQLKKQTDLGVDIDKQNKDLQEKLIQLKRDLTNLQQRSDNQSAMEDDLVSRASQLSNANAAVGDEISRPTSLSKDGRITGMDVELDPIVISPNNDVKDLSAHSKRSADGRILSVDVETEFVIVNLGEKDGIEIGKILSVYRGKDYLGDVKITRVQPEMSAADFMPPFSSRKIRKNDQVIPKE